jgi:two-component system, NtrC family, C4-dicarboxylate transport sensor histidine kinase DctB
MELRGLLATDIAQWRAFALATALSGLAAVGLAGEATRRDAQIQALAQAGTTAALHASVLRSELEKHQSSPLILTQDPDLRDLLSGPTPERVAMMNAKLEGLAGQTRAAVIYALDDQGLTLSASNWREPTSFVGSDYGFRPYYSEAMRDGQADFFALGTVSGRPGLYLSSRIDDDAGDALGVIVVKVEFDALEAEWRASGEPTYVTDQDGIVILTTVEDWRFHTTLPLTPSRRERLATEQTAGAAPLADMPFDARAPGMIRVDTEAGPDLYAHAVRALPDADWTIHLLAPAGQALSRRIIEARVLALLSVALLAGLAGILLRRRQRAHARTLEEESRRRELEMRVAQATAELREANTQLNLEMDERRRLEKSRQNLQDDLIQANKLATLGQIAASVAHEINQPVAAIRTHVSNAERRLERGQPEALKKTLASIADLTRRVGGITDELRAFSRKTTSRAEAVSVKAAIEGALLLAGPRLRENHIRLERTGDDASLLVLAERNRLEQVILNLLQNATDALESAPAPLIRIIVTADKDRVAIVVADNGPGVPGAVKAHLFTPFTTSKHDGVGLGLVISRDIVAGFGGELIHEPADVGACFRITLVRKS